MPIPTPTSWTSTGLDWTAADPMWPLELLNPCMIEAIKERDSATSRTVPALLSDTYNPIRPNWDYVSAIHAEVTDLIPLFVNHTDHGGDWSGQTTIPNWTEATILTAIGDSARIIPTYLGTLSAWYFQTRKILDMLSWAQSSASISNYDYLKTYGYYFEEMPFGSGEAWNSAKTEFNSTPWRGIPEQEPCYRGANGGGSLNYLYYLIAKSVKKTTIVNNTIYNCNIDSYCVFTKPYYIYENVDYPDAVEDKLFFINTSNVLPASSIDLLIGNSKNTGSNPYLPFGLQYAKGYDATTINTILKFDGPNGFKFKADTPST